VSSTPASGESENIRPLDPDRSGSLAAPEPEVEVSLPQTGFLADASWRWEDILSALGPYLGLLLVIGFFSYFTWAHGNLDKFLSLTNLKVVTGHAAVTATVALGMTLIMISGGIDLSVGYVVSLVTVTTVLAYRGAAFSGSSLLEDHASLVAIAAGVGTGALAGFGNGFLIARLKVVPFVVTLGIMGVARGLAQLLSDGKPVSFPDAADRPGWVKWLGALEPDPSWLVVGPAVWCVLLLAILTGILLHFTVLGRYCYALGSNEATARLCGIRVERTKIILYTLAGLLTGWAGVIQTARSGYGFYNVQAGLELEVIAAVVIGGGSLSGGVGTVTGTLVGAVLLGVLTNGCSKLGLQNEVRFMIIGAIIVVVAALNTWRQRRLR
jgi:ribose transport system permease protein